MAPPFRLVWVRVEVGGGVGYGSVVAFPEVNGRLDVRRIAEKFHLDELSLCFNGIDLQMDEDGHSKLATEALIAFSPPQTSGIAKEAPAIITGTSKQALIAFSSPQSSGIAKEETPTLITSTAKRDVGFASKQLERDVAFSTKQLERGPKREYKSCLSKRSSRETVPSYGMDTSWIFSKEMINQSPTLKRQVCNSKAIATSSNIWSAPLSCLTDSETIPPTKTLKSKEIWTDLETNALILRYEEFYVASENGCVRKKNWATIASQVNGQCNSKYTPTQCKDKVENMKKHYKKEKQLESEKGSNPSCWKYYNLFSRIMRCNSIVVNSIEGNNPPPSENKGAESESSGPENVIADQEFESQNDGDHIVDQESESHND